MNNKGLHCYVTGRVQGVFFRAATQRKAIELELTGWVCNLADGRVEVLAFGTPEQLEQFKTWLWEGPPAAQVMEVESDEVPYEIFDGFSVVMGSSLDR